MTNRRGMALLAALWFVVAIATVGLALSLEAREQRALGWGAADHRATQAAVAAGLAIARARLERVQQQVPSIRGPAGESPMCAADPLLDADAYLPPIFSVGNYRVRLHAEDLQSKLNINAAAVDQLRAFLAFVLKDFTKADALAQAIDPYLRVQGRGSTINVNTASPPVLRAIPGMTDAIITRIMAIRSQRQRITSLADIGVTGPLQQRMNGQVSSTVTELELTVTVASLPPAHPVQSVWLIENANNGAKSAGPTFPISG